MKRQSLIIAVLAALLLFTGDALAKGPGSGQGGGGGDEVVTPDYGDLIKLYRDADGVPYLTPEGVNSEGVETGLCQQPLPSTDCPVECKVPADGEGADTSVAVVAVDQTTCAIEIDCATCAQEIDFGRINEARSSDSVFAEQLADVKVNLATADCLSLDAAGRIVMSSGVYNSAIGDFTTITTGTVDSPLQNLAIYRQVMMTGNLELERALPEENTLITAARALGAASDKTGEVDVDLVAYLNQTMGLTDRATPTILPKICINVREEVMGTVQLVEKCFLDYTNTNGNGYAIGQDSYDREDNFLSLPSPAYIPTVGPVPGYFEILGESDTYPGYFEIIWDSILEIVFDNADDTADAGIGEFAQAADDTRAVIDYMHSWPVPADYLTPVPFCLEEPGEISFDVSISPESGLQVPVQMVATTEGREFTVTVSNAGPDQASGTVTVTAETGESSGEVLVNGSPGPFTIDFTGLAAGASVSTTKVFTMGEPHVQTTIIWTATVDAEGDVLESNNSVTATTNVRMTGGGGGSH